ncbi:hypothetical protein XM38_028440 [Halomicronema hongdechloris C2206]|uniref:Uncharacterized protein n=1 Tax=Halomicronema hongdechloris C2206 TaxID=1641165 RepID=A0A1Z3HNN8_9CYAN|nr:hypothetical protein [Halomicronema hongdechloris]ASC71890.1 hypothetical protein XM38_028440 [Halomicronema hongdechloris C2206]
MKSREELIRQHEQLLKVHEKVKDVLAGYPNVVNVGIGIKEIDGQLTEEGCIKIIVREKKSEADLESNAVIPKEVEGIKTDIVIQENKILLAVCAEDEGNYRPIKGGIRINNFRNTGVGGGGTLGCLAKLDADDSWVILSCHHVLYGQDGDEIGQPLVGCSWCCKTNVIAENFDKDKIRDAAIAKVKDDISLKNIILEIGNIQGTGVIPGVASPVSGERVRKRGSTTGLTSGEISYIDPGTSEITIRPNPNGGPADNPGGCTNYVSGVNIFAYHGDSGSVVVNDNNEVIALLYAVSNNYSQAFANDIELVQISLGITINTTSSIPGRVPISISSADLPPNASSNGLNEIWLEYIEERLEETQAGQRIKKIIDAHQEEVLRLVNKHRPVMVTWQRKQGPAFVAALSRSLKNPEYVIPSEINRVSLQNLLMSMAAVLEEHGSEALREDIQKYALEAIQVTKRCSTAEDFLNVIEQLDAEAKIQQSSILTN